MNLIGYIVFKSPGVEKVLATMLSLDFIKRGKY